MLHAEIIATLERDTNAFHDFCSTISDEIFFRQPPDKWSIAQHVKHLILSVNKTKLVYQLPKLALRLYTGKPNRPGRTYDELVHKYKTRLASGGKATAPFIPKPVPIEEGKGAILSSYTKAMKSLGYVMDKTWKDEQTDRYLAPHPLLGKITVRELGYFTIYHNEHHLNAIRERLND